MIHSLESLHAVNPLYSWNITTLSCFRFFLFRLQCYVVTSSISWLLSMYSVIVAAFSFSQSLAIFPCCTPTCSFALIVSRKSHQLYSRMFSHTFLVILKIRNTCPNFHGLHRPSSRPMHGIIASNLLWWSWRFQFSRHNLCPRSVRHSRDAYQNGRIQSKNTYCKAIFARPTWSNEHLSSRLDGCSIGPPTSFPLPFYYLRLGMEFEFVLVVRWFISSFVVF